MVQHGLWQSIDDIDKNLNQVNIGNSEVVC